MEILRFEPKYTKSDNMFISDESKKLHYLFANYTTAIGSYNIVPAKTIFGNNSKTKKCISWSNNLALGMYECKCGYMVNSTDVKINYNNNEIYSNVAAMHYILYHYNEIPISELDKINSLNINIDNANIVDDNCPIPGDKYTELFRRSLQG